MRFDMIDRVLETTADRLVAIKAVSGAEEYLADHFPTFPVLPGVLMLECMVQAGRRLADQGRNPLAAPLVLGRVRALKYGRFVKPGDVLRIEVTRSGGDGSDTHEFKGQVSVVGDAETTAASGRFTLRPASVAT